MESEILLNSAQCRKCGTVLVSKYRHDFVSCPCGNAIDGGLSYLKRSGKPDELEELSKVRVIADSNAPDRGCYTLPDGDCIGEDCMHTR